MPMAVMPILMQIVNILYLANNIFLKIRIVLYLFPSVENKRINDIFNNEITESILKKNRLNFQPEIALKISGLLLIAYATFLYIIAPHFTYAADPSLQNTIQYVIVRMLIGVVYVVSVILFIKKKLLSNKNLLFVILIGIIARLILIPTVPILEDDFNRYLWDGAVAAKGYNPYKYTPKDFFDEKIPTDNTPERLYKLGKESGKILKLVNHPQIRTIYPPVAQGVFVLTYIIKPWSVPVWKAIIFLLDLIVLFLLFNVLKKLNLSKSLIIIYWWNPVLLHEFYSAAHMDIIMYPIILTAIIFYLNRKYIFSSGLFALSFGVKVWPVVFIPFVLKKIFRSKKKFLLAAFTSGIILILLSLPVILTKLDDSLGFVTYSKNWTNNEAFFQLVNQAVKGFIKLFNIHYYCSLCVARWLTLGGYSIFIIYLLSRKIDDNKQFVYSLFLVVSVLYLISPTQFPWYYTWVLPILVLNPRLSFILYAVLLPFYQLKYYYPYLIWVEHIPVILLFILELYSKKIANFLEIKS